MSNPRILTIDGGSSSIKFAVFEAGDSHQRILDPKKQDVGATEAVAVFCCQVKKWIGAVLNEVDRFHLVMDAIDRLPQTGDKRIYLKRQLKDKLIEHKQYIDKNGEVMPEVRNWKWSGRK